MIIIIYYFIIFVCISFLMILCVKLTVSSQEMFKLHFSSYIGVDSFQLLKLERCLNLNMLTFDLKQFRASHELATSYYYYDD